jgi:hypothetical protein
MSVFNLSGGLTVTSDSVTYENLNITVEGGITAPIDYLGLSTLTFSSEGGITAQTDYLHLSTSIFDLVSGITAPIDYLNMESTPTAPPPAPAPTWYEQIINVFRLIYPILLLLLIVFFIALLVKTLRDFLKESKRKRYISETHAVA